MSNFTKDAIKQSFKKLLESRQLKDITIRDIVDDCGINRSSFYYHFQDIPALLEDLVLEGIDVIIQRNAGGTLSECMDGIIAFLIQNKRTVHHVYRAVSRDTFEQWMDHACKYFITSFLDRQECVAGLDPAERKLLNQYYIYLLSGFLLKWIARGLEEDRAAAFMKILGALGDPGQVLKSITGEE
ncbi:MAG: TetR/AcrR family transcriptional regulator C-terminal domain-containing protein [Lachnospiraceae bacterium]|nr:TetR/AcrR family transcriptional regulator C-terminal domain-containing protein [Lachnospiraceae bacterium]